MVFPANSPSFQNPLESKHKICFDFKNKRGCLKYYSSCPEPKILSDLNPWFITGFCDGESSFGISLMRSLNKSANWRVKILFFIILHQKDRSLLELIKNTLGVGQIYKNGSFGVKYQVTSFKEVELLIKHFDRYPLITQKLADYLLWNEIVMIVLRKEHLTSEGLEKILAIKASINRGLSDELKAAFPNIVPVKRPLVVDQVFPDPHWLAGFSSAEGCFFVNVYNSENKIGATVKLRFNLVQHCRDEQLMRSLIEFFGGGNLYKNGEAFDYQVTKFSDINEKIIPFFINYPILGVKAKDFSDFCHVAEIIKENKHLTPNGLDKIIKIKALMNKGRSV